MLIEGESCCESQHVEILEGCSGKSPVRRNWDAALSQIGTSVTKTQIASESGNWNVNAIIHSQDALGRAKSPPAKQADL